MVGKRRVGLGVGVRCGAAVGGTNVGVGSTGVGKGTFVGTISR